MTDLAEAFQQPDVLQALKTLPVEKRLAYLWRANWVQKAHQHQMPPPGDWWTIWLLLAGRGAGKTRTAAEQVGWWAWTEPNTRWLVGAPTSADVKATCFEGDSGLLNVIPSELIADYNKQHHELRLTNGSLIKGIPASEPERFRGPQFHGAWCCIPGTLIATPAGDVPIEKINAGDKVLTRHGVRRVLTACVSGNPHGLVALEIGDTRLTVTEDHPILVGDQWIPAGQIKEGDLVCQLVTSSSETGTLTGSSTSGTSARYRLGGLSTTRMGTKPTTALTTWRRCLEESIRVCTRLVGQRLIPRRLRQQTPWSPYESPSLPVAITAGPGSLPTLSALWGSSALLTAGTSGGATSSFLSSVSALSARAITWQRSASSGIAARSATAGQQCGPIELRPVAVRSVERLPNSTTYGLTVEGEHEFIANGIVVHNCDELAAWEYLQEAWDQIQFGVRLGKRTRIIATTTPRPKDLIVELVGREGDDVVLTTASTYANLANLAPSFQKQILQYEGTKLGRQEIHAEIIDPEEGGIVQRSMFKLWPDGKPFPKFEYIVQSYDCATSEKTQNDPTACTTWGVFKPLDGAMSAMLIDCWQERMQYPDLRPKVIDEYETVFGEGKEKKRVDLILIEDKSAGISLIQDLQRAHLPVRAYNPGKADKLQRLNIVSNIISRGRVWIPESSQRKGYVRDWAEGFVSQICSFPETTHDDFVDSCVDSLTQVQMADGVKAIKDIKVGDMVATPNGPRRVTAVHDNGMKEVWDVDGLLATAEHRVMTQDGWTRVDCLTQGVHNVYLYDGGTSWASKQKVLWSRRLSSMGAGITATLRATTRRIGGTSLGLEQGFTGMCGYTTTGQSQRGCTSTTLTATRPTMTSPIWPASVGQSTGQSIGPAISLPASLRSSLPIWSGSEARHQSGTDLKKARHGTENMPKPLLQRLGVFLGSMRRLPSTVFGAARRPFAKAPAECFAGPDAKPPNQSSVLVSRVTNTRTMRHVFDLTVEGEHCYYANGVLVHNCTQALRFLRDSGWLEIDPPPADDWDEDDYADTGRERRVNPYSV